MQQMSPQSFLFGVIAMFRKFQQKGNDIEPESYQNSPSEPRKNVG